MRLWRHIIGMVLLSTPVLTPSLASLVGINMMLQIFFVFCPDGRAVLRWPHCINLSRMGQSVAFHPLIVALPSLYASYLTLSILPGRIMPWEQHAMWLEPNTLLWLVLKSLKKSVQRYCWVEVNMCHHSRLQQSSDASTMMFPCTIGKLKTGQESRTHLYS